MSSIPSDLVRRLVTARPEWRRLDHERGYQTLARVACSSAAIPGVSAADYVLLARVAEGMAVDTVEASDGDAEQATPRRGGVY